MSYRRELAIVAICAAWTLLLVMVVYGL